MCIFFVLSKRIRCRRCLRVAEQISLTFARELSGNGRGVVMRDSVISRIPSTSRGMWCETRFYSRHVRDSWNSNIYITNHTLPSRIWPEQRRTKQNVSSFFASRFRMHPIFYSWGKGISSNLCRHPACFVLILIKFNSRVLHLNMWGNDESQASRPHSHI